MTAVVIACEYVDVSVIVVSEGARGSEQVFHVEPPEHPLFFRDDM